MSSLLAGFINSFDEGGQIARLMVALERDAGYLLVPVLIVCGLMGFVATTWLIRSPAKSEVAKPNAKAPSGGKKEKKAPKSNREQVKEAGSAASLRAPLPPAPEEPSTTAPSGAPPCQEAGLNGKASKEHAPTTTSPSASQRSAKLLQKKAERKARKAQEAAEAAAQAAAAAAVAAPQESEADLPAEVAGTMDSESPEAEKDATEEAPRDEDEEEEEAPEKEEEAAPEEEEEAAPEEEDEVPNCEEEALDQPADEVQEEELEQQADQAGPEEVPVDAAEPEEPKVEEVAVEEAQVLPAESASTQRKRQQHKHQQQQVVAAEERDRLVRSWARTTEEEEEEGQEEEDALGFGWQEACGHRGRRHGQKHREVQGEKLRQPRAPPEEEKRPTQPPPSGTSVSSTKSGDAQAPSDAAKAAAPKAHAAQPIHPPAKEAAAAPQGPPRTALEREILKIEKKVREVERLRQRHAEGEALESNQHDKLARGDEWRQRLAELQAQRAAELACEDSARHQQVSGAIGGTAAAASSYQGSSDWQSTRPSNHTTSSGNATFSSSSSGAAGPLPWYKERRRGPPRQVQPQPSQQDMWMESDLALASAASPYPAMPQQPFEAPAPMIAADPGVMPTATAVITTVAAAQPVMASAFPGAMGVGVGAPSIAVAAPSFPTAAPGQGPTIIDPNLPMMSPLQPMHPAQPLDVGAPDMEARWEACWEWCQTGYCPRGLTCRWEHPPLQAVHVAAAPDTAMQPFWFPAEEAQQDQQRVEQTTFFCVESELPPALPLVSIPVEAAHAATAAAMMNVEEADNGVPEVVTDEEM